MKRIILSVFAVLLILATAGAVYLNEVVLPQKIKSALIKGFEAATGKNIELSSAKLDVFRGLVIKDLAILDNDLWVVTAKEARARFLVIPIFKKQIVVTSLRLESPRIFVERAKDNSISIVEEFFKEPILLNGEYGLTVSRIVMHKATISFKDDTFEPPLLKDIQNAFLDVRINLPDRILFNTEFEVPAQLPMHFKMGGKYEVSKGEWSFNVKARDFYLKELSSYCKNWNFPLPEGRVDAEADVRIDGDRLGAKINMTSLGLEFSDGRVTSNINCALTANAEYDLNKKTLMYSGDMDIKNLSISGLEHVGRIDDIRGRAIFTESRFISKNLTCTLAGLPITASADLMDLKTGSLNINIKSLAELSMLKEVLKNKFNMKFPVELSGPCELRLRLEYKLPVKEMPVISGYVDVSGATAILDYNKTLLDGVDGRFKFTMNQLSWEDITFEHMNILYNSSGTLTNFEKPGIDIKLESDKLSVRSLLAVNGNFLTLSRFEGHYEDTDFSVYGDLDTTDPANVMAELNGMVKFELNENKEPFKRFKNIMKGSKPIGILTAKFALKGNVNDLSSCMANVEVSGGHISLYGFKMENFAMSYMQKNGVVDIVKMRASLYGGTFDASGRIDLAAKDKDYQVKAEIKDIKIEKMKLDTAFKGYDISGSIRSKFGFKGYLDDPSKFNAWGKMSVSNGKLWQLNLLKGIGTLVLRNDFSSVIFEEGDCDFSIKDKTVSMHDIKLKSDLIDINGVARMGFDNSVAASLRVEFTDEGVDASSMAGAIERYSIIEVSGTLKEPVIKIRPDLSNVVSDIAEGIFQQ